jgi:hypothetical protein
MDWEKEPRLAEFAKIFDSYVKDIMNVNDPDGFIYSHRIKGSISVCTDDQDDDTMYEIVGLDLDYLGGCGCTSGITIRVKKIED